MIRHLEGVLDGGQLQELLAAIDAVDFVDGRATNPGLRSKHNLQVPQNDPAMEAPGRIVRDALFRNRAFAHWAMPLQVSRPTISRYESGMYYGLHNDEALFPSNPPMRSDLSCTVFISEPGSYEGGELVMHLGSERIAIKYGAGDAVLYPTDAVHEVTPVRSGVRTVAILWIQSRVADARRREILARLNGAMGRVLQGGDEALKLELDYVRTNLTRMWSEP